MGALVQVVNYEVYAKKIVSMINNFLHTCKHCLAKVTFDLLCWVLQMEMVKEISDLSPKTCIAAKVKFKPKLLFKLGSYYQPQTMLSPSTTCGVRLDLTLWSLIIKSAYVAHQARAYPSFCKSISTPPG